MINKLKHFFISTDMYILSVYLFLFSTPWYFDTSQVVISSIILFIWGMYKYKNVFFDEVKILYMFRPLLFLSIFIAYCFFASLWSDSFKEGFKHVFHFHKYELLFGTALLISLTKEQAINGIKVLLFSFTGYSIFSILIYLDIIDIVGSSVDNPKGILPFAISTQYMVMSIFIAAFFGFYTKINKEKILYLLIVLLNIFALFVNYSRTSQLAFVLVLLVFVILFSLKNFKLGIITFGSTLVVLLILSQNERMLNKFDVAITEMQTAYENNIYKGSFGARLYFNKAGLEIIKDNFFFGMGPVDNRNELIIMEKADPDYKMRIIKHFHSEHMEILTAYGFVGYMLLFIAVGLLIFKLRTKHLYYYISMSVFFTLFFISFANKTLMVRPLNNIYIILFILLSIISYKNEVGKHANNS